MSAKATVEIRPSKDMSFDKSANEGRAWFGRVSNVESCPEGSASPQYEYFHEWFPSQEAAWRWAVGKAREKGWSLS